MEIRIDFDEIRQLEASYERAPEIVREELLRAVTEADLLINREVVDRMPSASGLMRQSVTHEERVEGLAVEGFVGSALNYVQPVELGDVVVRPRHADLEALAEVAHVEAAREA